MPQAPHRAVFVRHAQSTWNVEFRFSGWADIPLSEQGVAEAHRAGRMLRAAGYRFERAFTSLQVRATTTLKIILEELDQAEIPVEKSWRLNERHYGALEGLNKEAIRDQYGPDQFQRWRRGFHDRPPALTHDDPRHPRFDTRYADVAPQDLPVAESLADTYRRLLPYWEQNIAPSIARGERVLVVSHGNSLRALIKYLNEISDTAVEELEIPTGKPLVYEFDAQLAPRRHYYLEETVAEMAK